MRRDRFPAEDAQPSPPNGMVRVRGAREHNLKNVDVDIPRDALAVFTGVSGSRKIIAVPTAIYLRRSLQARPSAGARSFPATR